VIEAGVAKFWDWGDLSSANKNTVAFAIFTAIVEASPSLRAFRLVDGASEMAM
jgi:hypothetical protein